MSTDNFAARFARRMGCTVNLLGSEFDSSGGKTERGDACNQCGGCVHGRDGGIADNGLRIDLSNFQKLLVWNCPGCGGETVQDFTDALHSMSAAAEVLADPLCYRCRRRNTKAGSAT